MNIRKSITIDPSFELRVHSVARLQKKMREQRSSQHQNQPPLKTRQMRWFWCEADVYCRRGRWQIHLQPSWECWGTSREPKTTFPLNFFEIAVYDFSVAFFCQAKSVLKGFNDKKFNCVYIEFSFNHLAPSNPRTS